MWSKSGSVFFLLMLLSQLVKKIVTLLIFFHFFFSSEAYCIINALSLPFVFDLEVGLIICLARLFAMRKTFA